MSRVQYVDRMAHEGDGVTIAGRLPPPLAPRAPSVRELHGETVADDYAWMHDGDPSALGEYLAAERAYYDASSAPLDRLATTLAAEAQSRIPSADEYSVSWHRGGFTYRLRTPEHSDHRQLLRARDGETP